MKFVFNVPGRTPSLNQTLRMHWADRAKLKTDWKRKLALIMRVKTPRESKKMRVHFISYRAKLLDCDNYTGGAKSIRDCLVELGWLQDDSPEWCTCSYSQVQSKTEYLKIEMSEDHGEV